MRITDIGQLATVLASFRRSAGLTQTDVAQRLGVTKSRVSQIENAPERVTVAQLLDLLRALRVEISLDPKPIAPAATVAAESW